MPVTSDGVVWVEWVGQVLLAGRAAAKLLMAIPHHSGGTPDTTTVPLYPSTLPQSTLPQSTLPHSTLPQSTLPHCTIKGITVFGHSHHSEDMYQYCAGSNIE
mgnify:CR=1 FL=1